MAKVFVAALGGVICTLLVIIFVFDGDLRGLFGAENTFLFNGHSSELTSKQLIQLNSLAESGVVLTSGELLSQVNSFYSTIIVMLIVIISGFGYFGFVFIKTKAEDEARQIARSIVDEQLNQNINPKIEEMRALCNSQTILDQIRLHSDNLVNDSVTFRNLLLTQIEYQFEVEFSSTSYDGIIDFIRKYEENSEIVNTTIAEINESLETVQAMSSNSPEISLNNEAGNLQ